MVKVRNCQIVEKYSQLFNPGMHIPEKITDINGIDDNMVKGMPSIQDRIQEINDFIGSGFVVGHNIKFDIKFLKHELGEDFIENCITLDTLSVARDFAPEMYSYKLISLCRHFRIAETQEHRALADCILTHRLLRHMLDNCQGYTITIAD